MTPAEQAQQADLFCSKHQGHARKHGRRRDADGDGDDPTGAEVLRRAGGRRIRPIPGSTAMVPDRSSSSIFGAAGHRLDADLCTPCSHSVVDYIYR
jgi:hypothetical protein